MKSRLKLLAFLLLGALFAGCATSDKLNDIRIGMTKDQVTTILGKPDSMSAQANVEYLTYYLYASGNDYDRDKPYMIRLVDGKVESFGRFAQLFDLYNRPVTSTAPTGPGYSQATSMGAGPAQPGGSADIGSELTKLKALKDQGVLTDEEFQKAKEKLLSEQK